MKLVFEINYEDMFDKKYGCIYVGGEMNVHPDNVDSNSLTFFLLESFVEQYGYSPSDLIYFRDLGKNLVECLHLVSSDYDVAYDEYQILYI
jgi:hypothetical protein